MKARNEIQTALMIVSLLAALTAFAGAQVTAGAVIAGGGEGVSLYNLQPEVSIPLMERPSATMPFHMPPINVGNVNWVPVSGQWQPQSSQYGNPSSLVGSLSYAEQYEDCWSTSDQTYYYYYVYSGFSYTGPDGNVHDVGDPSSIEL